MTVLHVLRPLALVVLGMMTSRFLRNRGWAWPWIYVVCGAIGGVVAVVGTILEKQ
jgi:hypothetical protein